MVLPDAYRYSYNATVRGKWANIRIWVLARSPYLVLRVTQIPSEFVFTGNMLLWPNICLPPLFVTFNFIDNFLYCVYNLVNA